MDQNVQLSDMRKDAGIQDSPFLEDRPSVGSDPSPREIYNANNLNPVAEPYTSTLVKVLLAIVGIVALVGVITGSVALSEDNSRGTATTRNTVNIEKNGGVSTGVSITTNSSGEYVINLDYGSTSSGAYIRFLNQVVPGAAEENKAIVLDSSKGISGLGEVVANRFLGEVGRSTGIGISDGYFSTLISGDVATNIMVGTCSAIIGGYMNEISTDNSVILGGYGNTIPTGSESGILLGINNQVNGNESCIIAGDDNTVNASNSVNLAGERNWIAIGANQSAIAGGVSNQVYDKMSFVAGGFDNTVSGVSSVVIGGRNNTVTGTACGVFSGRNNTASGSFSSVVGGNTNSVSSANSVNIGGDLNSVTGSQSVNLGGVSCTVSSSYSVNAGGEKNNISDSSHYSFIGGGFDNTVSGTSSCIIGGHNNTVTSDNTVILGGEGLSTSPGNSWTGSLLCGRYNNPDFYPWDADGIVNPGSCYRFAVGSGTDTGTSDLAFAVDDIGNVYFGTSAGAGLYERVSQNVYQVKAFTIQHPTEEDKWLRHGCLEGPEGGVYYRGKDEAPTTIQLPDYATKIASNFTLQITPIGEPRLMSASEVSEEGSFQVFGNGKFHWAATGERVSLDPEPFKKDITIHSMGPYSWSV